MRISHNRLLIVGLALAVWLIDRPFSGIWHDSRFYTLQALQHLYPVAFSRDLFFLYGSQDQYSLFSHLHAAAIAIWGLNPGTMALQGLGLGLWFVAAWTLTRILPAKLAVLSLLLIASLDSHYGSYGVFAYGESFLTARLYAEAFSMFGLAAWLAGRNALGGLTFCAACAMHPLMTLPALVIGLGMLLRPRAWFGFMGVGVLLALGLGVMGVAPFTGLVQPMDALWWQLSVARSPFVFLHAWEWDGFSQVLFVTVVMATAWHMLSDEKLRRLAWVTLVCIVGAFAMAYLGGSLLKLPLIAGIQLMRVMWMGLVITLILVPALLWESHKGSFWNRILVWGLAFAVFLDPRMQGGYALLVLGFFWLGKRQVPDYKPPVWLWWLLGLVPLQIMLWGLLNVRIEAERVSLFTDQTVWRTYFSNPVTACVLVACAIWLLGRDQLQKPLKGLADAVVAGLLTFAMVTWYDLQPGLDYDSPERQAVIAPIATRVPKNATVYWVGEPDKAWLWLGRANYLSFSQTAGSIFARATGVEALRRAAYAGPVNPRDANQNWDERLRQVVPDLISKTSIEKVCRDPILDYVIARSQPGAGTVYFKDPATGSGYGLYDCRALRNRTLQYRVQLP